jgi:hypothetical protein
MEKKPSAPTMTQKKSPLAGAAGVNPYREIQRRQPELIPLPRCRPLLFLHVTYTTMR